MNRIKKTALELMFSSSLLIASSQAYAFTPINNSAHHVIRNSAMASRNSNTNNYEQLSREDSSSSDLTGQILIGTFGSIGLIVLGSGLYSYYRNRRKNK